MFHHVRHVPDTVLNATLVDSSDSQTTLARELNNRVTSVEKWFLAECECRRTRQRAAVSTRLKSAWRLYGRVIKTCPAQHRLRICKLINMPILVTG